MKNVVLDAEGVPLDAHFEIDETDIIYHSRGGTRGALNARNTDYAKGLRLLLERVSASNLAVQSIWVDSSRVQHLPLSERIVVSGTDANADPGTVFSIASRNMQQVGSATGAANGGNSNKRLRIRLSADIAETDLLNILAGKASSIATAERGTSAIEVPQERISDLEASPPNDIDHDWSTPSGRVWVTSFWDFNPESEGHLGFTHEGDRTWFLGEWRRGDLVMVYAGGEQAPDHLKGRVLGFLEIDRKTIRDVQRMSPEGQRWKVQARVTDRWTFAVPAVRAWRATDGPSARQIAPVTLGANANWQLIARRGALLEPDEAARALDISVQPTDVYGEAPLSAEEKSRVYIPSRGFPMSFGKRITTTSDGEHFLYAMRLMCDPSALLDGPQHALRGKAIVKVGLAKSVEERRKQLNASLPPAGKLRWDVILKSRALRNGDSALAAETLLKAHFADVFRSLGNEFFLCDERSIATEFAQVSGVG